MKRLVVLTMAILAIAVPAMAGNMFIDFEAPAYTAGVSIGSQNGWTTGYNPYWDVKTTGALAGSQSAHVDWPGDSWVPIAAGTTFANGTVVSFLTQVKYSAASAGDPAYSNNMFFGLMDNASNWTPYCGLYLDPSLNVNTVNPVWGWNATPKTYALDHILGINLTLNFTGGNYDVYVQDFTDPTKSFTINDVAFVNQPTTSSIGYFYMGGGFTYFDNISISTVPEPSALLALGSGLIGVVSFGIRRRK